MIKNANPFFLTLLLGGLVAGCASPDGRYPSLGLRDAERAAENTEPSKDDSASSERIDVAAIEGAVTRANAANSAFLAQSGEVRAAVIAAKGSGPEDNVRARALAGLATLTSLRGQTVMALGELDLMEVKAATTFARSDTIRSAQAAVLEMVAAQDAVLDSLNEELAH